jgi:hypothetical protein
MHPCLPVDGQRQDTLQWSAELRVRAAYKVRFRNPKGFGHTRNAEEEGKRPQVSGGMRCEKG